MTESTQKAPFLTRKRAILLFFLILALRITVATQFRGNFDSQSFLTAAQLAALDIEGWPLAIMALVGLLPAIDAFAPQLLLVSAGFDAMAGDPPLNQIVTRTWEAGVRGTPGGNASWKKCENACARLMSAVTRTSRPSSCWVNHEGRG